MAVDGRAGGGGGIVEEDMGDGSQCSNHPYRNNPGGICAFCLQEKLGKLVFSSFPRSSSCSSSSPSFRSDVCVSNGGGNGGGGGGGVGVVSSASLSLSLAARHSSTKSSNDCGFHEYNKRRARIPFLLNKKKKVMAAGSTSSSDRAAEVVFRRSKSTTTPRRASAFVNGDGGKDYSLRKRGGFWSFLFLSSMASNSQKIDKCSSSSLSKKGSMVVVDDDSPNSDAISSVSSSERKVSRSRSVGCGSRSFSGDFFERISTGFGDCTLRRVESQREGKSKSSSSAIHGGGGDRRIMKERVKCGGIFSGFIMTSSSSSSSSSSYWVSDIHGKSTAPANGNLVQSRNRSWGWAFASPMRAFTKPSSKDGKRDIITEGSKNTPTTTTTTTTGNLSAIPPLLAVG